MPDACAHVVWPNRVVLIFTFPSELRLLRLVVGTSKFRHNGIQDARCGKPVCMSFGQAMDLTTFFPVSTSWMLHRVVGTSTCTGNAVDGVSHVRYSILGIGAMVPQR